MKISTKILAVLLFFLAGCAGLQATPALPPSPTSISNRASLDLSPLLEGIPHQAPSVTSALVYLHGDLVFEKYYGSTSPDTRHEIYSCTKSFISTLVGIAIDKGYLAGVDQEVTDFFPDLDYADPQKEAITLEDVLTMSTGLDWEESDREISQLYNSSDWVQFMLDKPMIDAPGSNFNYCTGCSHLLSAIIEKSTGKSTDDFATEFLFEPLQIEGAQWLEDSRGTPIGGWGLHITAPQMAKLGELFLNDGIWEGEQIVSPNWVQTATSQHLQAEANLGYGYQWWIRPSIHGYAALGRDGQMIAVVPDEGMVVVFTSSAGNSEPLFRLIEEDILPNLP